MKALVQWARGWSALRQLENIASLQTSGRVDGFLTQFETALKLLVDTAIKTRCSADPRFEQLVQNLENFFVEMSPKRKGYLDTVNGQPVLLFGPKVANFQPDSESEDPDNTPTERNPKSNFVYQTNQLINQYIEDHPKADEHHTEQPFGPQIGIQTNRKIKKNKKSKKKTIKRIRSKSKKKKRLKAKQKIFFPEEDDQESSDFKNIKETEPFVQKKIHKKRKVVKLIPKTVTNTNNQAGILNIKINQTFRDNIINLKPHTSRENEIYSQQPSNPRFWSNEPFNRPVSHINQLVRHFNDNLQNRANSDRIIHNVSNPGLAGSNPVNTRGSLDRYNITNTVPSKAIIYSESSVTHQRLSGLTTDLNSHVQIPTHSNSQVEPSLLSGQIAGQIPSGIFYCISMPFQR